MQAEVNGIKFSDADVVNREDYIPAGDFNPHNIHPFLIHDHGFTVAVVFASNLQDALDIAVDNDKMDRYLIADEDLSEYPNGEGITYLGNAGEPFDIETIGVVELRNPPFSFVALYNADANT